MIVLLVSLWLFVIKWFRIAVTEFGTLLATVNNIHEMDSLLMQAHLANTSEDDSILLNWNLRDIWSKAC